MRELEGIVFSTQEYLELLLENRIRFSNKDVRPGWIKWIGISSPEILMQSFRNHEFKSSSIALEWMSNSISYAKVIEEYNHYLNLISNGNPDEFRYILKLIICRIIDRFTMYWTRKKIDPADERLKGIELILRCSGSGKHVNGPEPGSSFSIRNARIIWIWDQVHLTRKEKKIHHVDLLLYNPDAHLGEHFLYRTSFHSSCNKNMYLGDTLSGVGEITYSKDILPDPELLPGQETPFLEKFKIVDHHPEGLNPVD